MAIFFPRAPHAGGGLYSLLKSAWWWRGATSMAGGGVASSSPSCGCGCGNMKAGATAPGGAVAVEADRNDEVSSFGFFCLCCLCCEVLSPPVRCRCGLDDPLCCCSSGFTAAAAAAAAAAATAAFALADCVFCAWRRSRAGWDGEERRPGLFELYARTVVCAGRGKVARRRYLGDRLLLACLTK